MKKTMMLAAMVLALVASVLSASASAANWEHSGEELFFSTTVSFFGSWSFSGGVECPEVRADVDLDPGSTGTVTTFFIEKTSKCKVTGLLAALGCKEVTEHSMTSFWKVHDEEVVIEGKKVKQIGITGINFDITVKGTGSCAGGIGIWIQNSGKTPMVATPDIASGISSVALSGSLTSNLGTTSSVGGTMVVSPKGTIGL